MLVGEERCEVQRAFIRDREPHDVALCLHIQIEIPPGGETLRTRSMNPSVPRRTLE